MKTGATVLLVGLCGLPSTIDAADVRAVPIIVRDTLGNPVKQYRVEVVSVDGNRKNYDSPRFLRLSPGRVTLVVSASLHRPDQEDIDVSSKLEVIMVGLVRPTGSEISGEGSPANPSVRISIGTTAGEPDHPVVLRIVGIYSLYRRDFLVRDREGEMELKDLPFGSYRAFVFEGGHLSKEFELINEEFKPTTFRALRSR